MTDGGSRVAGELVRPDPGAAGEGSLTTRETAKLDRLLQLTSRTFALSIPLLPEPARERVGIAYLLFRIADTFEDSTSWTKADRTEALEAFRELLFQPDPEEAGRLGRSWAGGRPVDHEGYLELLEETPFVIECFARLSPSAREAIATHTAETARLMAGFVERIGEDGALRLETLDELRDYCYGVAGIVGEMLTELFLLHDPCLEEVAGELRPRARHFGEALQLVNILKDSSTDAREGRIYLPPGLGRSPVLDLAREDLDVAARYTEALREGGASRGVVNFCALPMELARATLDEVEARGPGAKISRDRLWKIIGEVTGEPG